MATPTERTEQASIYGDKDPFRYDYDTVRMTGLILAIVMFSLGIIIALSNKFKCKKRNPDGAQTNGRQSQTPAGSV
ncbi:sodium/potassium-transporting ATPase subunit gamma-like isoform X2 [Xenopus laevis]|uniref:FXYD domain-containing ion transport regulator n=1 Tax=Xenopus laevis TaxID=8355 RepID=A0A8J1L9Q3_XENLA|nr:sodium/potassium-transporting ATPase subunit gamma-like isoform X2 [Xenopus laevis]